MKGGGEFHHENCHQQTAIAPTWDNTDTSGESIDQAKDGHLMVKKQILFPGGDIILNFTSART